MGGGGTDIDASSLAVRFACDSALALVVNLRRRHHVGIPLRVARNPGQQSFVPLSARFAIRERPFMGISANRLLSTVEHCATLGE